MSISQFYANKTVAIIGTEVMIGMLLLERLLHHTFCPRIILLLKTSKNSFESKSKLPQTSKLFGLASISRPSLSARTQTVRFIESEHSLVFQSALPQIDVIFNCYNPAELQAKTVYRHIVFPRKVVRYLSDSQKTAKLIVLSSIYSQDSGYVPEDNYAENIQLPQEINPKKLESSLKGLKINTKEMWQLTIKALENIYFNQLPSVQIIRVPTIGATLKVSEGYIDKFNSMTWMMYQVGMGQITHLKGNPDNTLDLIPADYVANFMIVAAASGETKEICNLSTSTRNPIKLGYFVSILNDYWRNHRLGDSISSQVKIYEKSLPYTLTKLKDRLPSVLISKLANVLDLKALKINTSKKLQRFQRQQRIAARFQGFLREQWLCECNKSIDMFNRLSHQEKQIFNFNLNDLNWKHYIRLNVYSVQHHLLGRQVEPYSADTIYVINKSKVYFDDVYWAYTHGKNQNIKSHEETKRDVINSLSVKKVMRTMIDSRAEKLQKGTANYAQLQRQVEAVADAICEKMFSTYNTKTVRVFSWFMHKVFKQIYQQVVVDRNAIRDLKNYEEKYQLPLIVIPTHRSYIDFLVFPYIFFGEGIKTPFVGAADDFLNMALIHILFRKSGAFFITRNQKENRDLYLAILNQYTTEILSHNNHLKFFIQGTRSRLGKMMEPKLGLLNVVCETVMSGKIKDALIVPVTINYQKILEGASFPYQLLGEAKVKQSLGRLIKAVNVLKENYGQIHIQICKPISIRQYFDSHSNISAKQIVSELGYDITYTLSDNLVLAPTSLVATVVLMQRKGISEDEVKRYVNILGKDIHSKGIKIIRTQHNSTVSITNALQLMDDIVVKTKKNIFQVGLSANTQGLDILGLCYYRNTLTHVYFLEAIILVALSSFGYDVSREKGVSLEQLRTRALQLSSLISKEYVLRDNLKDSNTFDKIITSLVQRQLLLPQNSVLIANSNSQLLPILLSLVWPLNQSYYLTLLYLFKLRKLSGPIQYSTLLTQIQWFGESLINEQLVEHYEAISQDTIKNALRLYSSLGVIKIIKEEVKGKGVIQSVILEANEDRLKGLEESLGKFLKGSYAKSVKGRLGSNYLGSVALDFPFLARL